MAAVGDNILVGDFTVTTAPYWEGAAYLLDVESGSVLNKYLSPSLADSDRFGHRVAAVGNNVLVGDYFDDSVAHDGGAVYLYEGVPEPSTLTLAALGLMSLAFYGWCRRKSQ